MGGVRWWKVRIHLWSTLLSPLSHPLKITVPLATMGPFHPPAALLERQHRVLHLISTKAHHTFNFCFEFPLFPLVSRTKQFRKPLHLQQSAALRCHLPAKSPHSTSSSCSCVFSVHFLGLFFHSLIYAWGQLKLRERFGAAQGACISGGMQCTLPHHKKKE